MASIRFMPAVWLLLVFLAYVDAQLAFSTYDIDDTQDGDSITIAYTGTTYPVTFTLNNGDTGASTTVGSEFRQQCIETPIRSMLRSPWLPSNSSTASTASPFTFTIPLDQAAGYYTIEGTDDIGGDDSTDSFQITSAPANSAAVTSPAAASSTADRAGATTSAPTSTPPATTPATSAAAATSTTPAAVAPIPTSSAETSTNAIPTSPPTQPTTPLSNPTFSPSLTPGSTIPLITSPPQSPQPFSPTSSTPPPFNTPPSYPTPPPFPIVSDSGGLFNSNTTYGNNSAARSAMMAMPSASISAGLMRGMNSTNGTRSQFWVVEHKECRGGCGGEAFTGVGGEAFTGMGGRVRSGGLMGGVVLVVMAMIGGEMGD